MLVRQYSFFLFQWIHISWDPYDMKIMKTCLIDEAMGQLRWKSATKSRGNLGTESHLCVFLVPGALLQWVGVESLAGEFSDVGGWNGGWTHICQGFCKKPREWVSKLSLGKKWSWNFRQGTARCWRRWLQKIFQNRRLFRFRHWNFWWIRLWTGYLAGCPSHRSQLINNLIVLILMKGTRF